MRNNIIIILIFGGLFGGMFFLKWNNTQKEKAIATKLKYIEKNNIEFDYEFYDYKSYAYKKAFGKPDNSDQYMIETYLCNKGDEIITGYKYGFSIYTASEKYVGGKVIEFDRPYSLEKEDCQAYPDSFSLSNVIDIKEDTYVKIRLIAIKFKGEDWIELKEKR